jgi:hypothetical protein
MRDAILEEIWRVREQLIKRYGGMDGYFQYVQEVDRARRRRERRLPRTNSGSRKVKPKQ